MASLLDVVMHMVWPVSCPVCGAVAELLCEPCLRSLVRPQLPRCLWCGEPSPCKIHADAAKIRAGSVYEGYMKDVILALKYGRHEAIGFRLGKALANVLARPDIDILIPVPLHRKSKRRYNQAEAIAIGLGEVWGIEVCSAAYWAEDVSSRAGAGMGERLSLKSDVFALNEDISDLRVALVDDVCTTGSTLASLAKALESHGAKVVCACIAAHVPPIR